MKTLRFLLPIFMMSIFLAATSCRKDDSSSVGFTMKATDASNPVAAQNQSQDPGESGPVNDEHLNLNWSTAWMYISGIEFDATLVPASTEEIKIDPNIHLEWTGNEKVDLLGDPKIFANLEIPDGNYKDIKLSITSSRISDMNEPNFFMEGIFGSEFNGTPIALMVTQPFTMHMKSENGLIMAQSGNIFEAQIQVFLDNVFNGISSNQLKNATLTNGEILISATSNQELYAKILTNLQTSWNSGIGSLVGNFTIQH